MGRIFFLLLIFVFAAYGGNIRLKEPPKEIGKFYPPKSEGYVFVDLMHALSLSVTGTVVSVREEDWKNAEKWSLKLKENYLKVGRMVKKWDKILRKEAVNELVDGIKEKNLEKIQQNLKIIGKSCIQCHKNYKVSTRVIYRFPSFHAVYVEDPVSGFEIGFHEYMKKMTDDMKKLKVYLLDGKKRKAVKSGVRFIKRFEVLKQSCSDCHSSKDSEDIYFGRKVRKGVVMIRNGLKNWEIRKIMRGLKNIGIHNCTKCHNTHIIQAELQERFKKR